MKLAAASKSHIFLIELTIALLFFALTSAIALGLFVKAADTEAAAARTGAAVVAAQSIAETAKAAASLEEFRFVAGVPKDLPYPEEGFTIRCELTEEAYPAGTLAALRITAFDEAGVDFYSITAAKYFDGGAQ